MKCLNSDLQSFPSYRKNETSYCKGIRETDTKKEGEMSPPPAKTFFQPPHPHPQIGCLWRGDHHNVYTTGS